MSPLYDKTRRRIALATFFAVGVLPTVVVSIWALWWQSTWHVRAEAERLGWQLGMRVSLASVRHPRPRVVIYEGLELRNPETDRPVFRCRSVESDRNGSCQEAADAQPPLRLAVTSPEINASAWDELWRLLDRVLSRRAGLADRALTVTAEELAIAGSQASAKLVELRGKVETIPQGMQAEVVFRMAGQTGSEPARLRVMRNRQVTPPAVAFELESGGSPLSCPLLAMGLEQFGWLGAQSTFQGTLWSSQSRDGPSGEVWGNFIGVDLQRLASDLLPHHVSGTAEIHVETARFHGGRLQDASGTVTAGPGTVSRSLVEAAVERLGLTGGVGIDRPDRLIPYEKLEAGFAYNATGVRIQGLSPGDSPKTIVAGRRGPILSESQSPVAPLPLAAVIQALISDAEEFRGVEAARAESPTSRK
jgi:hypothetical protein